MTTTDRYYTALTDAHGYPAGSTVAAFQWHDDRDPLGVHASEFVAEFVADVDRFVLHLSTETSAHGRQQYRQPVMRIVVRGGGTYRLADGQWIVVGELGKDRADRPIRTGTDADFRAAYTPKMP